MNPKIQTPHEQFCFDTATHFTACRGIGVSRTKRTFDTWPDAVTYAKSHGDGRTMLYAINDLGNSAHVGNF